jgi:universal stress protein E
MKNLKTIVVGIDFSESSGRALAEAARIANWNDAELVCLHVFEQKIMDDLGHYRGFNRDTVLDAALHRIEAFVAATIGTGHGLHPRIAVGHPFKELVRVVEEVKADLLVMGSRGHQQDDPSKTGTIATRCVRMAPVDVLLIRRDQEEPFRRIVACIDFSENSIKAAREAVAIAVQDKSAVDFVSIYESSILAAADIGGLGPALPPMDSSEVIRSLDKELEELAETFTKEIPGLHIACKVIERAGATRGLVDYLNEVGADLAVLGTRGRTGLKSLLLGTTAERLMHESPCSALVVKPGDFHYNIH